MTLAEVMGLLDARLLVGSDPAGVDIASVCATDLMSDALTFARPRALLVTALANPQAVRTAEMAEISAVCFVRDKRPQEAALELGREIGIPLISTRFSTYLCCGLLYAAGLVGCDDGT